MCWIFHLKTLWHAWSEECTHNSIKAAKLSLQMEALLPAYNGSRSHVICPNLVYYYCRYSSWYRQSEKGVNSIKYRTVKLLTLQTIQLSSHYYMSIIIMCGRYIMIMLLSPNCIVCRVSVNHVRFKFSVASNAFLACLCSRCGGIWVLLDWLD